MDLNRELEDLIAVNAFHLELLEKQLGHKIPVPAEILGAGSSSDHRKSQDALLRWVHLLDIAVTAPMMRDALKDPSRVATAASLYRYYILKASASFGDRDKTDFIGTFLLKNPPPSSARPPGAPGGHSGETYSYVFSQKQAQQFQAEIETEFSAVQGDLPQEHAQLLREFQYLHQEADEFRHFDQLMDSGILQRVRELKNQFGPSFYHPRVLAASAVYNVFFGKRFDDLFRDAASQIKAFAAKVQQEGGSIMARVDGDVTVKNLSEVEEANILQTEYGRAREQLQKVSRFKKAVDTRRTGRVPVGGSAPSAPGMSAAAAARGPRPANATSLADSAKSVPGNVVEDNKAKGVVESVRNFVRAADAVSANIVPMRNGNIVLTPAELEAFKADYTNEKSFRADYANMLTQLVALHTRMQSEMDDYKAKRSSSYLWKPHADSLTHLMVVGNQAVQQAAQICVLAEQRGLGEKVKAMNATAEKLKAQINVVAATLQA